jgi:serine/threonine-protein kinase
MLTLIDGNEYVKVLDFGLVKAMEQEEEEQQLTSTGQVLGTPQYMPPEQAGGERVDARGDLYSLTGVLYFCLTGHSPFGANTVRKALQAALTQRPPPIATHRKGAPVPEAIDRFCIKGLDPEPDARFQSCEAFIEALHAAIASASDEVLDAIPERVAEASKEVGAGSSGASKREGSSARSSRLMSVAAVPKSKSPLPGAAPVSSRENPTRGERPPSPDAPNRRSASALAVAAVSAVLVAIIVTSIGLRLMRGPPSAAPQGVGATATRASPAGPSPAVAVRTTGSETPSVKDEPKEPTSDLQPQNIRIALKTVPPGAEVVEEGVTLGTTPLSIEWTRAQKRSLTFKLSGYRTLEKALRPESDQAFEFILEAKKSKSPGKNSPAKPSEDDINTFE